MNPNALNKLAADLWILPLLFYVILIPVCLISRYVRRYDDGAERFTQMLWDITQPANKRDVWRVLLQPLIGLLIVAFVLLAVAASPVVAVGSVVIESVTEMIVAYRNLPD